MQDLARCERNVLPTDVVDLARRSSKQTFVGTYDAPLLLIRVDGVKSDLVLGLSEAYAVSSERLMPTIGYDTEIGTLPVRPLRATDRPPPISESPNTPARIQAVLARGLHFMVPLKKRADTGRPFEERVTIGRARNSDIVLRHPSISKFHAWFECDEDDRYFLSDGRSRNGTFASGNRVVAPAIVQIAPGTEVRFAAVEAFLTTAEVLWDAFSEYRPSYPPKDTARGGSRV